MCKYSHTYTNISKLKEILKNETEREGYDESIPNLLS